MSDLTPDTFQYFIYGTCMPFTHTFISYNKIRHYKSIQGNHSLFLSNMCIFDKNKDDTFHLIR
jgi:hypothetical protein